MKKIIYFFLLFFSLSSFSAFAQPAPAPGAADKKADPKADPKAAKPMAFWATTLPTVTGKLEAKYDINQDELLQTSETKILLRHVVLGVNKDNFFNVQDSHLLALYDKNKDGVISKYELLDIKKDLSY